MNRRQYLVSAVVVVMLITLCGACACAQSIYLQVQGAADPDLLMEATRQARSMLQAQGYQITAKREEADLLLALGVTTWSHHSVPWTFWIGWIGLLDIWNYDSAHSEVQARVVDSEGEEVWSNFAQATKHEIPILTWLWAARKVRSKAQGRAVSSVLQGFFVAHPVIRSSFITPASGQTIISAQVGHSGDEQPMEVMAEIEQAPGMPVTYVVLNQEPESTTYSGVYMPMEEADSEGQAYRVIIVAKDSAGVTCSRVAGMIE